MPMGFYLTPWWRCQQARYRYRQALNQIRKGNVDAALAVLSQALDHYPHRQTFTSSWARPTG